MFHSRCHAGLLISLLTAMLAMPASAGDAPAPAWTAIPFDPEETPSCESPEMGKPWLSPQSRDDAAKERQVAKLIRCPLERLGPLAQAGSTESIQLFLDCLNAEPEGPGRLSREGLKKVGKAAVIPLARFMESYHEDAGVTQAAASVLSSFGEQADDAVPILAAIASDGARSKDNRVAAVEVLGFLGPAARSTISQLAILRNHPDADLQFAASLASAQLGDKDALRYILEWAAEGILGDESGRIYLGGRLRRLARLGQKATPLLPTLCAVVREDFYFCQNPSAAAAAEALGWQGSGECLLSLEAGLRSPRWWTASSAALSLGRLGVLARSSLPVLEEIGRDHWSQVVRRRAQDAQKRIQAGMPFEVQSELPLPLSRSYFFSWLLQGDHGSDHCRCERRKGTAFLWRDRWWLPPASISHPTKEVPPRLGAVEDVSVVLEVDDGWLVGVNRGEFGGELRFVDRRGGLQKILEANVVDVLPTRSGLLVLDSLSHLSISEGRLFRLSRNGSGPWRTELLVELPSEPRSYFLTPEKDLILEMDECFLAIEEGGRVRQLPCRPACAAPACQGTPGETCCQGS